MTGLDDRDIARLVRRYLDRDRLLAEHPEVSSADLEAFLTRHGLSNQGADGESYGLSEIASGEDECTRAPRTGRTLVARCDGASRGNPGPGAIGVLILDETGRPLRKISEAIGYTTNNVAEYEAVIRAAQEALRLGAARLTLLLDSELLVRQLQGVYRVKAPHLQPYHQQALSILGRLDSWEARYVPREENAAADELANQALDEAGR